MFSGGYTLEKSHLTSSFDVHSVLQSVAADSKPRDAPPRPSSSSSSSFKQCVEGQGRRCGAEVSC
ncbi:hypothetical protein E2C01_054269 [Portunus trituberculatus]|uniref:Uncharacterized protein n=1 Tax=Portunus trituberculatus TaxID=210409 RepID=A0A5B7GIV8_PORTR|nr:hypothetical protein [Portunus trituberculatus]